MPYYLLEVNTISVLTVNGTGITPSKMKISIQDISSPDAGRTLDGVMHKDVVASKRTIDLTFNGKRPDEVSSILKLFEPVYVDISFHDPREGKVITKTFYTGDINAESKIWTVNNKIYSSISFSVIER